MPDKDVVLLVAHDTGPSRALKSLQVHLESQGVGTCPFLYDGGQHEDESNRIAEVLSVSAALVCGISSQPHCDVEVRAAEKAVASGVPIYFFADTFGAWARESISGLRQHAHIFAVNEADTAKAACLFPVGAHFTGNPLWETDHRPHDRIRARARLGVHGDDFVIFIAWTKTPSVNIKLAADALDAAASVRHIDDRVSQLRPVIVIGKHPGDKTDDEVYVPILAFGQHAGVEVTMVTMPGDICVEGADVLVHSGPASLARRGACIGVPIIDHTQGAFMQGWLHQEIAEPHTPLAYGNGAFESSSSVGMGQHFRDIIEKMIGFDVPRSYVLARLEAARAVYPRLQAGEAVERMSRIIRS